MMTRLLRKLLTIGLWMLSGGVLVFMAVGIWYLESRPDLRPWHDIYLKSEVTEDDMPDSFNGYLEAEAKLFEALQRDIVEPLDAADKSTISRFTKGSKSDPAQWQKNWNHSFELPGSGTGILLLHGMSDSPYSLRAFGKELNSQGHHIVGLRLPGHGTAPSGLVHMHWEDMAAAVRMAMRHLRKQTDGRPVYIIGYSNGAALAVHYSLSALSDTTLPPADGLVLISPQIQITPAAALAKWQSRIGRLIGFAKLAWNSLGPEYDPFKYISFAVNAGQQSFEITQEIARQLEELSGNTALAHMPKTLSFQSVADATIVARGIVDGLLKKLPSGNHHLVLFDMNRESASLQTISRDPLDQFRNIINAPKLPFDFTFITNIAVGKEDTVARFKQRGEDTTRNTDLNVIWPDDMFSLSHVALPFPPNDPLYGRVQPEHDNHIYLGRLDYRGERGILEISANDMLRQRWNPFYSYMLREITKFIEKPNTN
ncbi:MAG: alpha/beta hydrolase [Hyphomicrobiales bacterium]